MDKNILSDLLFWRGEKCDPEDTSKFDFQKLKLASHNLEEQILDSNVYFILDFAMDSQKQIHIVSSYKVLEFLGDIGGFLEAIEIIFSTLGTYFSGRFLKSSFITKFFKRKVHANQSNQDSFKGTKAKSGFQSV